MFKTGDITKTRDGSPAEVIKDDLNNGPFTLVAIVTHEDGTTSAEEYTKEGKHDGLGECDYDLMPVQQFKVGETYKVRGYSGVTVTILNVLEKKTSDGSQLVGFITYENGVSDVKTWGLDGAFLPDSFVVSEYNLIPNEPETVERWVNVYGDSENCSLGGLHESLEAAQAAVMGTPSYRETVKIELRK